MKIAPKATSKTASPINDLLIPTQSASIKSTPKKTGRPLAVHKTAWGEQVSGLMRLKDGRWRASGPEKFTFTEPDERLAVARFRQWEQSKKSSVGQIRGHAKALEAVMDAQKRAEAGVPIAVAEGPNGTIIISDASLTPKQWAWLREQIYKKPQWVAQMVGIEQIAYLTELKKPAPSPTLKEVGKEYTGRNDITEKELQKCGAVWEEFCRAVGVETLRELTPERVAEYGKKVKAKGQKPKTVYHYFNRVKTVLNHFRTTGRAIDEVRKALDCCAVLKAPETTSLNPHPISRPDFQKLLDTADDQGKAVLLAALNFCFYPIDVVQLTWRDLGLEQGVYHAKRGKTKVARCAVLWQRTIEALKALPKGEYDERVFHKESGRQHTDTTLRKWFFDLRADAKLDTDVQFADIRDGSYTAAVQGEGVEFQHARVLAGHRSGIADAYVLRNPKMVAKACAAVEKAYFG